MSALSSPGRVTSRPRQEPQGEMPESGVAPAEAAEVVRERLDRDFHPASNLATFLTTSFEPEAEQLFGSYSLYNLADRDQYPGLDDLAQECVRILGGLWHGDPDRVVGSATTGSSEAAMLAGATLLRRWQARAGDTGQRPNLVLGAGSHVCWLKFCRHWGVEARIAPARPGSIGLDAEIVGQLCDESTIGVISVLGSTLDGSYDPVREISDALDQVALHRGADVPLHIDAASGGLFTPFVDPEFAWDFQLPRVVSINASGHKYGLVPPGLGWVLWRSTEARTGGLGFSVNYLGTNDTYHELTFSKSAAPVVLQYYNFVRYGFTGYRTVHTRTRAVARMLASRLRETGRFHLLGDGSQLPVIALTAAPDLKLSHLAMHLADRGWSVPVYSLPPDLTDVEVLRIVVRNDLTADAAESFASAVREFTRSAS